MPTLTGREEPLLEVGSVVVTPLPPRLMATGRGEVRDMAGLLSARDMPSALAERCVPKRDPPDRSPHSHCPMHLSQVAPRMLREPLFLFALFNATFLV
jgi:hypothetical protein